MVELLKWSLGEPCSGTVGCFFFLLGAGLVDSVLAGAVVVSLVSLVHLCYGSSSGVASLEVASFRLLDFIGMMAGDLIGVW